MDMKVSDNPSSKAIRWRWNALRLAGLSLLMSAIWSTNKVGMLVGAGLAMLVVSYIVRALEEEWLLEVYDEGINLRLQLGETNVSVVLTEIDQLSVQDGEEGRDYVRIALFQGSPFGRYIDFFPLPLRKFHWNVGLWIDDVNRRISNAKAESTPKVSQAAINASIEAPTGQVWM
ncbi:hypothetical protein [Pseudoduganella rhizocola]|uniref:hypothetical protein n=1 Tax=Pseudoduganella rhizocola TaxID=3382643 RepID=UPI0038B5CD0A